MGTNDSDNSKKQAKKKIHEKLTLGRLEGLLLGACDALRGSMDASEYKEYVFGMLFLKRISDRFDEEREKIRQKKEKEGVPENRLAKLLSDPTQYDSFFVPEKAHWNHIRHLKKDVGTGINKALAALEDANPNKLQDVLKHINFNRKIGQQTLSDEKLVAFIQEFEEIPLRDEDFEFPDLLGAAYEYLIKYFADSAGKKGGEFYTPAEVVRLMVELVEPGEKMEIYDPTVGSGGMLIQSRRFIEENGGNPQNISLYGQENNGGTWAICKMNMLLHGIADADIRQGDTIQNPRHVDSENRLRVYDRILANPPFSQNYAKTGMEFPGRFHTFMPESGKKADLMFVQHMLSVLKGEGRMATVMPHGVLFRGGEERAARKRFIDDGLLEAVIGLPPGLFYGTGIPAAILVMNRSGAKKRNQILFINADLEYKEGKAQNFLRPEDIQKISYVYHNKVELEGYSRMVPASEIETEEHNLNIRRYVDNSPPPEPQDVRAHIHGGIPDREIESLDFYFEQYAGTRDFFFAKGKGKGYADLASNITEKGKIKELLESAPGVQAKEAAFLKKLEGWWKKNRKEFEALPSTKKLSEFRKTLFDSIAKELLKEGLLDLYRVQGAMAQFLKESEPDIRSIMASGWSPLLVPDEEILASQFPDVLAKLQKEKDRLEEIESLFAEAKLQDQESDDGDSGDSDEGSESGVLRPSVVKDLKEQIKMAKARIKEIDKDLGGITKTLAVAEKGALYNGQEIGEIRDRATSEEKEKGELEKELESLDAKLARHNELDQERKSLKDRIRETDRQKDELLEAARAKIDEDEARRLILERFYRSLVTLYTGYLSQYRNHFIQRIENLYDKYAVTLTEIQSEREQAAQELDGYLKELGYV